MKNKNQKGAITLFVLVSLLFFIMILINLYVSTSNRAKNQIATTKKTIEIYGKTASEIEDIYQSYFGEENVIPIYTAEELQQLTTLTADNPTKRITIKEVGGKIYEFSMDKVYLIKNDIDASVIGEWTAIGTQEQPFNGILEGANHTITGININKPDSDYQGMFGYTGTNSEIRNLKISNGEIIGKDNVGGIVGYCNGKIENCGNEANVIGNGKRVGGIVGNLAVGTVNNCYNTNKVESILLNNTDGAIGGIAGINYGGEISVCWNTGEIAGKSYCIGGIVGINHNMIKKCYNEGKIICEGNESGIGGIAGFLNNDNSIIQDCYNNGEIIAENSNRVGGIAGDITNGKAENCYNIGKITGKDNVGSVLGINISENEIKKCYYLESTCIGGIDGKDIVGQAEARTAEQLKSSVIINDLGSINWKLVDGLNSGYPVLAWQ